jgi:hypothetical protein
VESKVKSIGPIKAPTGTSADVKLEFSGNRREVDIIWPSGIHQVLHKVAGDQIPAIEEVAQ